MAVDIIYAALLILALVLGFTRGLISSLFTLIAVIISVLAAVHLSRLAAEFIGSWLNWKSPYLPLIAFIVICFGVLLLFRLLAVAIERIFSLVQLTLLNKLAGAVFWAAAITLLFSTLLWYAGRIGLPGEQVKANSKTYATLIEFAPLTNEVISFIVPPVKDIFNDLNDWFDGLDTRDDTGEDTHIAI